MGDDRSVPEGFDRMVRELAEVYQRRSLQRKKGSLRHLRDQALPIFACVEDKLVLDPVARRGEPHSPLVLTMLASHLQPEGANAPHVQVPHLLVPLKDTSPPKGPDAQPGDVEADEVAELVELLDRATAGLKDSRSGKYEFPRYDLVRWLMRRSYSDQPRPPAEVRHELYKRALGGRDSSSAGVWAKIQDKLPVVLQVASLALIPGLFWLRHSGRIPFFGRPYRWLRGQRYIPRGDDNLFELALRLTEGRWSEQDPELLARLLVHAVLEDLRAGFRPVEWIGRYRATHPILLVGPISRTNGGYLLVRMVEAVRNDTQRVDPLVLVTAGRKVPPRAAEPETAKPNVSMSEWRESVQYDSLLLKTGAWIRVFPIGTSSPSTPLPAPAPRADTGSRWLGLWRAAPVPKPAAPRAEPATPPPPLPVFSRITGPMWRNRRGGWLIIGSLLTLIVGGYLGVGVQYDHRHCGGDGLTWLGFEDSTRSVTKVDGDCVGITDGTNALLFPSESFAPVRAKILEQNKLAEELSKAQPERPVATLVFMASADDRSLNAGVFTAEREQLAGLAVAQAVQLSKPKQRYEPILRVLIANAGPQFRHADRVADQLRRRVADDPTIVAVVGLVESRQPTETMIRKLADAGLPTIAATLTADSMVDVSRMYLQVSPQNRREAAVAAAHVKNLLSTGKDPFGRPLARQATVYKSDDPADTYSQNLARDLQLEFAAAKIPTTTVSYNPAGEGVDANQAGRDACDRPGAVFFAGRGLVDFEAFLGGIQDRCRTRPPLIIGGDDVTKWAADREVSARDRSIPFQYLSLAMAPGLLADAPPQASDFYTRLQDVFGYEKTDRGRSLDGHAALSYDAAYSVVLAVNYLRRDSIAVNGGTVWSALQSMTDADGAQRGYQGVTGRIDFGGSVSRRVPMNKPVAIVTFSKGSPQPGATLVCGAPADSPAWCPVDQPVGR